MTLSTRETALRALHTRLAEILEADVPREIDKAVQLPGSGLQAILRDGNPGDPDETIGVRSYGWRHEARVEVHVLRDARTDWQAQRDEAIAELEAGLMADRQLGGTVLDVQMGPPLLDAADTEGSPGIATAVLPIFLIYETATATG